MITEQRQQAFYDSMAAHHLVLQDELVANGYYVAESAKDFVPSFLENKATAIVCGNDLLAYGTIKECEKCGYRPSSALRFWRLKRALPLLV